MQCAHDETRGCTGNMHLNGGRGRCFGSFLILIYRMGHIIILRSCSWRNSNGHIRMR